jgi:hypothetical protein
MKLIHILEIWYIIGCISVGLYLIFNIKYTKVVIPHIDTSTYFGGILVGGLLGPITTILLICIHIINRYEDLEVMNIFHTKSIIIDFDFPKKFKVHTYRKHKKYNLFLFSITILDRTFADLVHSLKNKDNTYQIDKEFFEQFHQRMVRYTSSAYRFGSTKSSK